MFEQLLASGPHKWLQPLFHWEHVVEHFDLLNVLVQEHVTLVEDFGHLGDTLDALGMLVESSLAL